MSRRVTDELGLNDIARERQRLRAAGIDVTDLTDSNPTRHGLLLPGALDAVARRAGDAAVYRPNPRGPVAAREALADRFGGQPDDYWITSSTSESYSWLLATLGDPGDAVAVPAPGYPLVEPLARLASIRTAAYQLHYVHPREWVLDVESVTRATADPRTRAVVVVNPGNPTGSYFGPESAELVEVCRARGLTVVADEVFEPFALQDEPTSWSGETRVPTVTLGGLSKLLCAPQLKIAWMRVSGPEREVAALRASLDAVADLYLPASGPVAAALPDLLGLAPESVAATRARLRTNLAAAHEVLGPRGWRVRRCGGGWTVLVDAPSAARVEDLALRLLQDARLAVHPGWFYDLDSAGALAVSLLPGPERFRDNLSRLAAAGDRLGGG